MELDGKVAIVSGAARGQGASHSRVLAENGATILLIDRLQEEGEQTANELRAAGHNAMFFHGDVRDNDLWANVMAHAMSEYKTLDILVNNAGVVEVAAVADCSDEEWTEVLDINLGGVFRGTRAAVPAMKASGGGAIVNTASVYGVQGVWGYAAYVASKSAVIGLTKTTAITYGMDGIRANAVAPSAVDTPMLDKEMEIFVHDPYFDWDKWLLEQPLSRVATPLEVSQLVLFLASDRSSYSTGGVFPVDGGRLA